MDLNHRPRSVASSLRCGGSVACARPDATPVASYRVLARSPRCGRDAVLAFGLFAQTAQRRSPIHTHRSCNQTKKAGLASGLLRLVDQMGQEPCGSPLSCQLTQGHIDLLSDYGNPAMDAIGRYR